MLVFPNAKINIGLNITEKRTDGFHNIESVFYPVQWTDALEIVPASQFNFTSSGLVIEGNQDNNLIIRALKLFENASRKKISDVAIHLHKVIPMGAGLGGGSADGAFALKLLNELFECGFSSEELQTLARQLGSDCAFFIENKPVFCYEKGDKFAEITLNLAGRFIVLVNPMIHISTAEAYAGVLPQRWEVDLKTALNAPIDTWKTTVKNDFEQHILTNYPKIELIKKRLYEMGAAYASMTGSGSTVYGIFNNEVEIPVDFQHFMTWKGELQ
jgi:4-diphosphocytidyl-2-C-methyl-D-erythritol kinase